MYETVFIKVQFLKNSEGRFRKLPILQQEQNIMLNYLLVTLLTLYQKNLLNFGIIIFIQHTQVTLIVYLNNYIQVQKCVLEVFPPYCDAPKHKILFFRVICLKNMLGLIFYHCVCNIYYHNLQSRDTKQSFLQLSFCSSNFVMIRYWYYDCTIQNSKYLRILLASTRLKY